jgi:hypothetical protein
VEFFSGGKFWCERTRALAKIGIFLGIFGEFLECLEWLGPIRKYFLEPEGPTAISSNVQGMRHNLPQGQEASCKIVRV